MSYLIISIVVAIIIAFLNKGALKQPHKMIKNGELILKNGQTLYLIISLPAIMLMAVLLLAILNLELKKAELQVITGFSGVISLIYLRIVTFLKKRQVIVTKEGVLEKYGRKKKYLAWDEIIEVKYYKLKGTLSLISEKVKIPVNINFVGINDFIELLKKEIPTYSQKALEEVDRQQLNTKKYLLLK